MSTSKERARAQQGPRTSTKKAAKLTPTAEKKTVRSAFHQPTGRDYVKKMTIEIDRDLHAKIACADLPIRWRIIQSNRFTAIQ